MHKIITIGREFGSGGRELGRRLSEKLRFAYYDQEIVTEIAKRTKLSEEYVRWVSESRPFASFPIHVGRSFCVLPDPALQPSIEVFSEQHRLLRELSEKSDCIIVGRCADYILKEKNPFRIFVYADEASKLKRCMERQPADETLTEREMKKQMAALLADENGTSAGGDTWVKNIWLDYVLGGGAALAEPENYITLR